MTASTSGEWQLLKSKTAREWLLQQSPLLMLVLIQMAGVYYGLPPLAADILTRVEDRLKEINSAHDRRFEQVLQQHAEDRRLFQAEQQRLQQINESLLEAIRRE